MSLLRNFATVGTATMASRVLGFVRDMLLAAALGVGPVADAFVVALRLPNLFRRIFAEGAFNSAFVPLYARTLEGTGAVAARGFASQAFAGLAVVLVALTVLAEIFMPALVALIAPGFAADPDKFALAVTLTRIAFPYLIFVSLMALCAGVLNGHGRFAAAAYAPVLLNVVLIAALLVVQSLGLIETRAAGMILAGAVTVSGLVQLGFLLAILARSGHAPRPGRPRLTDDLRRLVRLGIPGVLAGGIMQINIVIGTIIASAQPSAVSYLYYADRLYQLPLGVVGVAIGVALLPDLSRRLKTGDEAGSFHVQNRAIEFAMLLTLPAALALALIGEPVVRVLFERGAFEAEASRATADALAAFALGLPAFVLVKVFQPGFFAREDTRTPMYVAGASVAVNVAASLSLFPVLGHVGIALATSLSGLVNAGLLALLLARRGGMRGDARLIRRLAGILAATALMGAALALAAPALAPWLDPQAGAATSALALALVCAGGAAAFFATAFLAGAVRPSELRGLLARRRR